MSIKRLLSTIDKPNLLPMVRNRKEGEELIARLGQHVIQNHEDNESSMSEWLDVIKKGLDVAKIEVDGDSYPFKDAANYKSPLITEAVRQFGDKAKTEIMSSEKLCACSVQGIETEQANASCNRIEKHINWQINSELRNWRQEHTRLLYTLAGFGAVFKKTYFDATEGCNASRVIKYPNFSLNQECSSLDDANFTEVMYYSHNDIFERKAAKLWSVPDDLLPAIEQEESDKEQFCFVEQCINFDLDNDGYEEPLLVTVHKQSGTPVRVVARYSMDSMHVFFKGNTYNLQELIQARTQPITGVAQYDQAVALAEIEEIERDSEIVRIVGDDILTYYGFVEPTDGSFLSWGFLHLLASPTKGINKTTNALLNAGEFANLQGGWLSKEHRDKRSGEYKVQPGYFKQTNISAQALANSVFPLPFKEPSATLLALNQEIKNEVRDLSARFNSQDAMKSGVSAASVLGALQEGVVPTTSLIMNVITAMTHEFGVMYKLNALYTEPLIYQRITGVSDFEVDYNQQIGIRPTANAMHSNQMQRITLAQAQMEQLPTFLQIGGNPEPIVKGYYEALGTPNMSELFPEQMTSEQQQQQQQMLATQQAQTEALQQQNKMLQYQLQLSKVDTDRRVFEAQTKAQKEQADLQLKAQKLQAEIMQMQRKMLTDDAQARMRMEKEIVELQTLKADTLKKLAETDNIITRTAEIEQSLAAGDVNALQSLNNDDLLAFIGVTQ